MQRAGIVIRTVFNNQGWAGPCRNPLTDVRWFICKEGGRFWINAGDPIGEDGGICKGQSFQSHPDPTTRWCSQQGDKWCWEQSICTKYLWRNPKHQWGEARVGMRVYFVYIARYEPMRLKPWGRTVIKEIHNEFLCPTLYLMSFEPLPASTLAALNDYTAKQLVCERWNMGLYRYLDDRQEAFLKDKIEQAKESR